MKLNHLAGHKQQFSGRQEDQLKMYKFNTLTHIAISSFSTTFKVFNSLFVCRQKSTMHPQHYICLIVISLGVCWVDGIFLTTTAANGALTFTIPTLTATTGTAAAVLGGLGALGAGKPFPKQIFLLCILKIARFSKVWPWALFWPSP